MLLCFPLCSAGSGRDRRPSLFFSAFFALSHIFGFLVSLSKGPPSTENYVGNTYDRNFHHGISIGPEGRHDTDGHKQLDSSQQ